ncbi:MAG: DUF1015 domain-containing protein [Bacteroidetes bacterium]|nr:DUF1015 domain-containing protein [Bacteroidota bacterium]
MASIRPFKAIRPNPLYADRLVQTTPQVQSVAGDISDPGGLPVLKIALEIGARQRPETPEGQARAYQDIDEEMELLMRDGRLLADSENCIYVYEVVHPGYRQTGIWALTDLDDYKNGTIRTHELTFSDSVRRIKNYRKNTRLEGSPVLVTYKPHVAINRIIAETIGHDDSMSLSSDGVSHILWRIDDESTQRELINAFAQVRTTYLADGHHRLESSSKLAAEQRANGESVFDTIATLYMATDQLRIQEFNRVVIPSAPIEPGDLLTKVAEHFEVLESDGPVLPRKQHKIGMRAGRKWFELSPRFVPRGSFASALDASILQEQLLAPVFGIDDPVNDTRLKCIGGAGAMSEIEAMLGLHPEAIAFTLCPLDNDQLLTVADAGEILPPKSTWIDPKIPFGLLLYRHEA